MTSLSLGKAPVAKQSAAQLLIAQELERKKKLESTVKDSDLEHAQDLFGDKSFAKKQTSLQTDSSGAHQVSPENFISSVIQRVTAMPKSAERAAFCTKLIQRIYEAEPSATLPSASSAKRAPVVEKKSQVASREKRGNRSTFNSLKL